MSIYTAVNNLTERVRLLKRSDADVIRAINEARETYGLGDDLTADQASYSRAKNRVDKSPRGMAMMSLADRIVSQWEKEQKGD